ncbi:MAG TPA: type II toxin-antitoxin system VapC family toxin [Solirubrobacterales bacterium]|nr:type II toxin-antitoxin system VapC family toxin [Solirubrobacterales bacterium]
MVDATAAVAAVARADGFEAFGGDELVAPSLMWSEARSTLHLGLLKGKVSLEHAVRQHERLESCPVRRADPPELGRTAWEIAEQFGWGRTYDAEYVALAQLLGCRLVTLDGALRRGADRLAGDETVRWHLRDPPV